MSTMMRVVRRPLASIVSLRSLCSSSHQSKWSSRMVAAGASSETVKSWKKLVDSVGKHQELLKDNKIGLAVDERERIRVNARRVGLEAPPFADEAENEHSTNVAKVFSN